MKNRIILAIFSITLLACGGKERVDTETPEDAMPNRVILSDAQRGSAGIVTGSARQVTMATVLKLNGRIEVPPQNLVSVSAPLGGYLRSTSLLPGMRVKKGEVIAIMEDQKYISLQQDYLTAKANMKFNESEYERQKVLNVMKSSSDKVLQKAEAEYASQRILLASLGEQLRLIGLDPDRLDVNSLSRSLKVYAPVSGFVTDVKINAGKYVTPTDVMFELVDPGDIHLALTVFEKDVEKLHTGQKLKAYSNSNPGKIYNCEIIQVGKKLAADRGLEVHCHFLDAVPGLLPGMYMNADITVESDRVTALGEEAILDFEGANYVFTELSPGTYEMLAVETGISNGGFTEIKNPERINGKKIVTRGAYSLLMSLKNKAD